MTEQGKQSLIKGNKFIAEYMGYSEQQTGDGKIIVRPDKFATDDYPKYHSSWDELMPVARKCIKELEVKLGDDNRRGSWTPEYGYVDEIYSMNIGSKINEVWGSVVNYILRKKENERNK